MEETKDEEQDCDGVKQISMEVTDEKYWQPTWLVEVRRDASHDGPRKAEEEEGTRN